MPGLNGVEATRRIVAANPSIAVLVLTMLDEDESVFAAMRAGARGYVVKGADTDDLLRALESVARGDVVFGPAVASRVLSYLTRPLSARDPVLFPELTAASGKSWNSSPAACPTPRSPASWSSHPRPCATTSATSSPNSKSTTAPKR